MRAGLLANCVDWFGDVAEDMHDAVGLAVGGGTDLCGGEVVWKNWRLGNEERICSLHCTDFSLKISGFLC